MNVSTITMPKEEAKAKLEAYRAQNAKRVDEEYQAAEAGYAALAEGTPLISLTEAIRNGGLDEKMRPKLAIARADRKQVRCYLQRGQSRLRFDATTKAENWRIKDTHIANGLILFIDMGRRDINADGYALVPMVPADVREDVHIRLADCFVLWEVEAWSDQRIGARPDRDPFLLRHIGGDLYAVIADWDLTELERLVMAGRRDQ